MKRIKAIAGIIVIFALGAMTGALGMDMMIKHRIEMFHEKGPPHIGPMFMQRIGDRLDLTADQRLEVGKILDNLEIQLREIRQGFDPKIKIAFDDAFKKIGDQLTEPQQQKLNRLKEKFPRRFRPDKCFRSGKHKGLPGQGARPDQCLPEPIIPEKASK
jgi:hypothetical protein